MDKKGNALIGIVIVVLIILGIMYLLNVHADNTRENPQATNPELIGQTIADTGEDVAVVAENWFEKMWKYLFLPQGTNNPPSTTNNNATNNASA